MVLCLIVMNYYIFRHGQTHFSKFDIPYGDQIETAELLPEGIPAITKLAEYLKSIPSDANFTSPYIRCVKTSQIIENITGKKFETEFRLHDYNQESIQDMINRLKSFLNEVNSKKFTSLNICTHGYPIAILKELILKNEFNHEHLNFYPKPGVLIEIKEGIIKEVNFNQPQ